LVIKQGELTNMSHFLLIEDVSERAFDSSEDTHLVRITYRRLEKFLQCLDFLELGCFIMPMKMYPVPNQGLTGPLNNFEDRRLLMGVFTEKPLGIIP
jgi:hypothetical protein